jgi:hypothetical protein
MIKFGFSTACTAVQRRKNDTIDYAAESERFTDGIGEYRPRLWISGAKPVNFQPFR